MGAGESIEYCIYSLWTIVNEIIKTRGRGSGGEGGGSNMGSRKHR